jgi:hypothetical protein
MIVSKIYLYFKSYTVRVETLKKFCDFIETEFEMMLGCAQRRWLALPSAIEKVFKLFMPIKSYFQSQDKISLFLLNFFENLHQKYGCTFITVRLHLSMKQ